MVVPTLEEIEIFIDKMMSRKQFVFSYDIDEERCLQIFPARAKNTHLFDVYIVEPINGRPAHCHHTCWYPLGSFLEELPPMALDMIHRKHLAQVIHQIHRLINLSAFQ
jgi:hypothetical protein